MSAGETVDSDAADLSSDAGTTDGTGLEPNIAGAIAYVFGVFSGVAMLVLDGDDEFVRFHAIQSIAFSIVVGLLYVAVSFVALFLSFIPRIGGILAGLAGLFNPLIGLASFVVWAFLVYKAYDGERWELPLIGSIAASK